MASTLSETLLHDLRVVDARSVILELCGDAAASFPVTRRSMLHLVLSGSVSLRTGGAEEPVGLDAGDCVLLLYGDPHLLRGATAGAPARIPVWSTPTEAPPTIRLGAANLQATILCAELDLAYVSPSAFANRAGPGHWVLRRGSGDKTESRAFDLDPNQVLNGCRGSGGSAFVTALGGLLLVQIIRSMYEETWHDRTVEIRSPNTRRVATAIREIHTQLNRDWTVASLAHEVGLSRSAFAEAFRSQVGMTPLAYVTELRMQRAAQLLEIEAITSREIAHRVGYALEASFARAFKKYHGISPHGFAARERR